MMVDGPMIRRTARVLAFSLFLAANLFAGSAWALDLDQAQARGLVGETRQGYLAAIDPSAEVKQLVDSINLQRRQLYRDIARKNGTSLDAVEAIAGQKAIARAKPGEFVQDANGNWVQK